tara:strand:- start:857 stop:1492 length:636 start_codon:yes stop_codon:yes gene_type:complete
MSKVNVNTWEPETGTAATLMASGDTVTVPSGATLAVASGATIANSGTATGFSSGDNTPAFQAYLSANSTLADGVWTKIPCNTEDFDTDSAYDPTTNYRFTVPAGEGGKYYLYVSANILYGGGASNTGIDYTLQIRVNAESDTTASFATSHKDTYSLNWTSDDLSGIRTLSAADYVEFWVYSNTAPGYNSALQGNATPLRYTYVGAYKMTGL